MRVFLVLLATVVACTATRPWSVAESPGGRYYATWPQTTGIYQLSTQSADVVVGELTVQQLDTKGAWLVPQTSAIAIVYDELLDATLMFCTEIGTGQVVRYTLDESGPVSVLSDRITILSELSRPESLTFDVSGETACIAYMHSAEVHMVRCYRISRRRTSSSIDEWWISVGHYPYAGLEPVELASVASLSSVSIETRARPMEHAALSIWVDHAWDTARRVMTRFPLVTDGSTTPSSAIIYHDGKPAAGMSQHIVWQHAPGEEIYAVLSEHYSADQLPSVYVTQWSADGEPSIVVRSLDPKTLGTATHTRIALWLVAQLDSDQLVDVQVGGSLTLDYNRTAQANSLGYAQPSSASTEAPSASPLPVRVDPSPSSFPEVQLPVSKPTTPVEEEQPQEKLAESEASSGGGKKNRGLFGLLALIPVVCCCGVALMAAVHKRRSIKRMFVLDGTLAQKLHAGFGVRSSSHLEAYTLHQVVPDTDVNLIEVKCDMRDSYKSII